MNNMAWQTCYRLQGPMQSAILSAMHKIKHSSLCWEESCTLVKGLVLGGLPDGKAEGNLVDKVCKIVDEVQAAVIDTAHEVAKEVASWIDGPACGDDETHGAERGLDVFVR